MSLAREVFISVDIETSGPIPGEYSLLSIGACWVDDDSQAFECELQPINSNAVQAAMEVTGLSLDRLQRDGIAPSDAMHRFRNWLEQISKPDGKLVFVGFNASFDWSFVNYYFHLYLGENPFGFTALDIKSLFMGATGCDWDSTRSSKIASVLQPSRSGSHDALQDARYQAEIFRLIRKIAPSRNS
jgi:DNA polymerase III epsilon subunit-like protein